MYFVLTFNSYNNTPLIVITGNLLINAYSTVVEHFVLQQIANLNTSIKWVRAATGTTQSTRAGRWSERDIRQTPLESNSVVWIVELGETLWTSRNAHDDKFIILLISHIPDECTVFDRCNHDILSVLQERPDCVVKSLVWGLRFQIGFVSKMTS